MGTDTEIDAMYDNDGGSVHVLDSESIPKSGATSAITGPVTLTGSAVSWLHRGAPKSAPLP